MKAKKCVKIVRSNLMKMKIRQLVLDFKKEINRIDSYMFSHIEEEELRSRLKAAFHDEYLYLVSLAFCFGKLDCSEDIRLMELHSERKLEDCKMIIPTYLVV